MYSSWIEPRPVCHLSSRRKVGVGFGKVRVGCSITISTPATKRGQAGGAGWWSGWGPQMRRPINVSGSDTCSPLPTPLFIQLLDSHNLPPFSTVPFLLLLLWAGHSWPRSSKPGCSRCSYMWGRRRIFLHTNTSVLKTKFQDVSEVHKSCYFVVRLSQTGHFSWPLKLQKPSKTITVMFFCFFIRRNIVEQEIFSRLKAVLVWVYYFWLFHMMQTLMYVKLNGW